MWGCVFMCVYNIPRHHCVGDLMLACDCFTSVFHHREESVIRVAACVLSSHGSLSSGQTLGPAALQTDTTSD